MTQATHLKIAEESIRLDLGRISVGANHRRRFDDARLKELAANIKAVGVLQPLLVRPHRNGGGKPAYQLIAGERRLRAAKMAGLSQVPARVLDVDDQQAAEIQAFENLHREDLTPIEEAHAFKTILDKGGFDVKALADRVDKSPTYVYRAIALLELPPQLQTAIEDGRLTAAHGHQILRLPAQRRAEACRAALTPRYSGAPLMTAKELQRHVDDTLGHDLADTCFPKDKPFAGEIACTGCPYNSGNQGQLFDGAQKGRCLNSACFDKKTAAGQSQRIQRLKDQHPKAKVLTTKRSLYDGTACDGFYVVGEIHSKAAAAVVKEGAPYAVMVELHSGGEIEPYIGVKDKKLAEKLIGHSAYGTASPAKAPARRSPKEAFMDRWLELELFRHVVAKTDLPRMLERILEDVQPGYWNNLVRDRAEALGLSEAKLKSAYKGVTATEDRIRFIYTIVAAKKTAYGGSDDLAKKVGIDVRAFLKSRKAAAEKAWEESRAKPKTKKA